MFLILGIICVSNPRNYLCSSIYMQVVHVLVYEINMFQFETVFEYNSSI